MLQYAVNFYSWPKKSISVLKMSTLIQRTLPIHIMAITSEMDSSNVNITSGPIFFRTCKYFDFQCSYGSQEYVWQETFLRHCHQKKPFATPIHEQILPKSIIRVNCLYF